MLKRKFIFLILMFCSFILMGQNAGAFSKEEISALKSIAQYYNIAVLWCTAIAAVLLPVLTWFSLKSKIEKWAEDKAMAKIADKLNVQKEVLENTLRLLVKEFELKKQKIVVVSPSPKPIQLAEFIANEGFSNADYLELQDIAKINLSETRLVLFNYLNRNLVEVHEEFGSHLLQLKDSVRIVVLGTGQLPPPYKEKAGNKLSFSNGYDTLTDRILGAFKQPV
ncbi:MAG: hypothetical protein JNK77_06040 [Saprospiraceae bacterium]|nr:hypothetical protein [Saprospiraceae bacterium]